MGGHGGIAAPPAVMNHSQCNMCGRVCSEAEFMAELQSYEGLDMSGHSAIAAPLAGMIHSHCNLCRCIARRIHGGAAIV